MSTITCQLVNGLDAKITHTKTGIYWCELTLRPRYRYDKPWCCCPGMTKSKAIANALRQAQRLERREAA